MQNSLFYHFLLLFELLAKFLHVYFYFCRLFLIYCCSGLL